ncbi:MAG: hypothetical protein IJU84_10135 [Clostridia bacterium]|nr:hypothetical protein [Clostridia bacterium]
MFKLCPKCQLNYITDDGELCTVCRPILHTSSNNTNLSNTKKTVRVKKEIPRRNIAFKCTYCDGGRDFGYIGFCGACSPVNIKHNIESGRVLCSASDNRCGRFLKGEMSYEELKKFDDLCYESNVFRLWQFGAGGVIKGKNKGKPNRLLGVKRNSLCVFTTKKPFSSSLNRIVFAVSIVAGSIEGGEYEAGLVKSHENIALC